MITGERGAGKLARPVREEDDGKGPTPQAPRRRPTSLGERPGETNLSNPDTAPQADSTPTSTPTGRCRGRRSPISCTRYRVSIRSRRISGGGTNDGANNPCSSSCAIHSASRTSLLRPGHGLHVRRVQQPHHHHLLEAIERRLPIRRRRLHRRDTHPSLDQPVPHHPQRPGDRLERPRLRCAGPRGLGVRTHTFTESLPTSRPATRSNMTSMTSLLSP